MTMTVLEPPTILAVGKPPRTFEDDAPPPAEFDEAEEAEGEEEL